MENRPAPLRSRRICRFCLTENEPLNFIYDRELSRPFQVPLSLQIMSCVSIEVYSADGMPQMICSTCRFNLDRCYKFKQQCKKADEALRAYPISGVLPRPMTINVNDPSEQSNKRNLDGKQTNEQVKKPRLDNGDRERQPIHQGQRQTETRSEKQQREKEEQRRELYEEEEQDQGTDGEQEAIEGKEDAKLEPGEIRVHACNQCDRTFPLQQSLQIHIQRAHRDRNYKCTECDRMFFSKYDLNKHMTTHSEEKPYSCDFCPKQFARGSMLQRHLKMHQEELRYGCPNCDREFLTPEELEKHEEAVHKAVKPYQCNICNKRFNYKQGLERHEMLHNEDKSFVCDYCKEAFRTSTKLARHLTTHAGHRPYMCKLCPRTFLLSHHLTRHMRSHSVEKRHQCEECGKAFKRKESLEVHQLTHTTKRVGMGLTCDVCNESCRNRADYVTHIKQHIEAGEKMGPDGLPPDNKEAKLAETESEEEEEEEDQYSDGDDDYEPPSSYHYAAKKMQKPSPSKTLAAAKIESEEEQMDKEEVVYIRGKDGVVKKTIKTLMPIQRRGEQQSPQETKKVVASPQVVNSKQIKHDESAPVQKTGRHDETEAQVQKIVASVFKEHKIPLKHQAGEQVKETTQIVTRQASQPLPSIIKEEKLDTPIASVSPKNVNTVKVIKRIVVRKPAGSASDAVSTPVKELVQEAVAASQAQASSTTPSTSGPKVTKRVIVRRIIRQGDTTREVIMNPDGTIIDPAELAKLPTGNVVKRVVVKKPLDKGQNIEAMLQSADAKSIIRMAECGEDISKASSIVTTPKPVTTVHRVEHHPQQKQVILQEDRATKEKLEQLEKRVEQQRLKIEELQARKQQEYEADDMMPERHDESEDEQQLPLKRVFVKRKQSIYDEEREYTDDTVISSKDKDDTTVQHSGMVITAEGLKEEELSQTSTTYEMDHSEVAASSSPTRAIEDAKIIIIKPEDNAADVDEMSRELCSILDSTDSVVKMQENVLSNLTQITSSVNEMSEAEKNYDEVAEIAASVQEEEAAPTTTTMTEEEPMEQEVVVSSEVEEHNQEQVEVGGDLDQNHAVQIVITQSEEEGMHLEVQSSSENNQIQVAEDGTTTIESTTEGCQGELPSLTESNDMFETSETVMEVDGKSIQEQPNLDESVIELSATNETINLNETTDSRDSLEDKLSQMEG
ncbi:hypothetical protein TSAR_002349 [Trichomalopsis sarcophagae]|uniref:Protein krueppel n=1 Tax=Trichomalopsis sarcophagae TaxID=543379 RepID=A0A232FE86_9HYME|nr:hypothetical protein TSAR_002349 [Trichomalopsis sarcophagae]